MSTNGPIDSKQNCAVRTISSKEGQRLAFEWRHWDTGSKCTKEYQTLHLLVAINSRGGQGTSTRLYPGACINFPGLVIQTQIIDGDDHDDDAGLCHGPYSCPSQILEAE